MSLEGRHEIDAAMQRLATAKKWTKAAADAVEMAKSQYRTAQNEEKEAEAFLRESEKRWEVIDVDAAEDGELQTDSSARNNKRRKVSLSLAAGDNINSNTSPVTTAPDTDTSTTQNLSLEDLIKRSADRSEALRANQSQPAKCTQLPTSHTPKWSEILPKGYVSSGCSGYQNMRVDDEVTDDKLTIAQLRVLYRESGGDKAKFRIDPHTQFDNLRLHRVKYPGPSYGLTMIYCSGRVIVKSINSPQLGPCNNPKVGSIIVAANSRVLP